MDEYVDLRVIEKLVDIEQKILVSYQYLFIYKYKNCSVTNWLREKERLELLIKKENILLNKLPKNSQVIDEIYNLISANKYNFFDNEEEASIVLERISFILKDIGALLFDKEESELYDDLDEDDIFESNIRIGIRDNILIKYLIILDRNFQDEGDMKMMAKVAEYFETFCHKNVGDFFIENNFNIDKITYREDAKMAKELKLSMKEYNNAKNIELTDLTYDAFFSLLAGTFAEENPLTLDKVICDILKFRFLLHEMPTPLLLSMNDMMLEELDKLEESEFLEQVYGVVSDEISKRKDIPKKDKEENPTRPSVDEETATAIIELIKLDEKMLSIFDNISLDEDNSIKIQELSNLVKSEKEIVSRIYLDYANVKVIEDLLVNDLDFFLSEEVDDEEMKRKCDLINERIHDLLPFYQKMEASPIQSQVSYECIHQNHIVSTLKNYKSLISETEDNKKVENLKEFFKYLFFLNAKLTDDYIYTNGNYEMIDCFSDSITAQSIGLSDIEYSFDKDEQLYEYARIIIEEILSYEDEWDRNSKLWAAFKFKLSEIDDIIKNISAEHFCELPYLVKDSLHDSEKTKKLLLNVIEQNGGY